IKIGGRRDIDVLRVKRNDGHEETKEAEKKPHRRPKNTQQTKAPTTLIESPQIISLLKSDLRSTDAAAFAIHRAPSVERGETSTRCAPTFTECAIAIGFPPPIFWINP